MMNFKFINLVLEDGEIINIAGDDIERLNVCDVEKSYYKNENSFEEIFYINNFCIEINKNADKDKLFYRLSKWLDIYSVDLAIEKNNRQITQNYDLAYCEDRNGNNEFERVELTVDGNLRILINKKSR